MSSTFPSMPRKFLKRPQKPKTKQPGAPATEQRELFLTAFEKPTQIYRYLAIRHAESPIFLHRNLSYLSNFRNSRPRKKAKVNIDEVVKRLTRIRDDSNAVSLKILSFHDDAIKSGKRINGQVNVETFLLRKTEENGAEKRISIGKHRVASNVDRFELRRSKNEIEILRKHAANHTFLQFSVNTTSANGKRKSSQTIWSQKLTIFQEDELKLGDGIYEISFEDNNKENKNLRNHQITRSSLRKKLKQFEFDIFLRFRIDVTASPSPAQNRGKKTTEKSTNLDKPLIFQFIFGKFSQKTEASLRPICPWCLLNCGKLCNLLRHLRLCHFRLAFKYVKSKESHHIAVIVNEHFDNRGDLSKLTFEYNFSRAEKTKPARRFPHTRILVAKKKNAIENGGDLSQFSRFHEPDVENQHRRAAAEHRVVYHHSGTGLPKFPEEFDEDSEEENDPRWLRDSMTRMVDAFRDVNDGEKQMMSMWNLFVLERNFVGDRQIKLACNMFVDEKCDELIDRKLYKNFLLHLANLVDFGVIDTRTMYAIVKKLQCKISNSSKIKSNL